MFLHWEDWSSGMLRVPAIPSRDAPKIVVGSRGIGCSSTYHCYHSVGFVRQGDGGEGLGSESLNIASVLRRMVSKSGMALRIGWRKEGSTSPDGTVGSTRSGGEFRIDRRHERWLESLCHKCQPDICGTYALVLDSARGTAMGSAEEMAHVSKSESVV